MYGFVFRFLLAIVTTTTLATTTTERTGNSDVAQSLSGVSQQHEETCAFTCPDISFSGQRQGLPLTVAGSASYVAQLPLYYSGEPGVFAGGNPLAETAYVVLGHNMSHTQALFCQLLASDAYQATIKPDDTTHNSSMLLALQFLAAGESIVSPFPSTSTSSFSTSNTCSGEVQNASQWLTWESDMAWISGNLSVPTVYDYKGSSYTVMDTLVSFLKDKNLFPKLEAVTITGFGKGADVRNFA